MSHQSRSFALFAFIAAALLPASAAQAQWYSTAPARQPQHHPYAAHPNRPYAVEVGPNTYAIRRPAGSRHYPYVHCANGCRHGARTARVYRHSAGHRPYRSNDHVLTEQLRQHRTVRHEMVGTEKVMRDRPVVIETERVDEGLPRHIDRRHHIEDAPRWAPAHSRRQQAEIKERITRDDLKKRVIKADAEVTILGPDRMIIRLFRKGSRGGAARARAQ
jgi:hypothetical protein